MSDAARDIFHDWSLPIWLTASVVLAAIIYTRGWFALRRTRPEQFNDARLASFLSGLALLWLAIGSPMDGFADALLSAHMVEHLIIMSFVPPLLLYGLPVVPLLRGLPKPITRSVIAPLVRRRGIRTFAHWLVRPRIAWLAMNISYLAWHVPGAYDFALEHENWHVVEHLCFFITSVMFWWCVMWPWPASTHKRNWGVLIYLIGADAINTMLAGFLAFCDRPVYRYYIDNPNPFGVSLLKDQVLGASIMWVVGSLVFLIPAIIITFQLLAPAPRNANARAIHI